MKTMIWLVISVALYGCSEKQGTVNPEPAAATHAQPAVTAEPTTPEAPPGEAGPAVNGFAVAFGKEARELPWAAEQEAALTSATSKIADATLRGVECRKTVCRLEFSHSNGKSMQTFGKQLVVALMSVGPSLRSFGKSLESDEAKLTTTAWLTRDGYAPPKADGTPVPSK